MTESNSIQLNKGRQSVHHFHHKLSGRTDLNAAHQTVGGKKILVKVRKR
jgi:hypothetical protein